MFMPHRLIPKILKSEAIKRKEIIGYPNLLKKRVAIAIVPRKRINLIEDSEDSMGASFLNFSPLFWNKNFKMKAPDKTMRRIPRIKGNIPVPAILKVPMGIFKERRKVINPKANKKDPPRSSSLFKISSFLETLSIGRFVRQYSLPLF